MSKKIPGIVFLFVTLRTASQTDSIFTLHNQPDTSGNSFSIPLFSTSGNEAETGFGQQDISPLLQSSRDLFTQYASFQFGAAGYRMRGYFSENHMVMINGLNVNNPETGSASWSIWGGLNDVTRFTETQFAVTSNRNGSSGVGGYTNIDSRASSFKKGTRLSYALASKTFRHRFMLTHSTGNLKNNWAFTISISARYGDEVYIPGTYFNSKSFYFSADKKISNKHLFSFTGFVSPTEQGRSSSATLETYKISGTNYYNDCWGYQNGKGRNANVSSSFRPLLMFSHIYSPNQKKRLSSTIFYSFGNSGVTGLNFYNTANPHPDYYKYLPSYYYLKSDTSMGNAVALQWQNDVNTQQINWDRLIEMNRENLYSDPLQYGIINTNETRARYILEKRVEKTNYTGFNIIYNERLGNIFISGGISGSIYKCRKYKQMEDLLGATYWIDVDQFAQNMGADHTIEQNDIDHPDKKIFTNDRFGYDYLININKTELWGQMECSLSKFDFYTTASLSENNIWRSGKIANGKFPLSSKGDSQKLNFLNYGFKAGAIYKISGRHFLTTNVSVFTKPPEASNIFISPAVRNDIVEDIKSAEIVSGDINYVAKYPNLKIRITAYSTSIKNQTRLRSFWSDVYNTNINLVMTNINQRHSGIEIGVDKTIYSSHIVQFVLGFNQSVYTNEPKLQAWQDNNNAALFYNRKVYLINYRLGNSPQLVSAIGYKFNSTKSWFAGVYFNYFDEIYIEPNPDRRTNEAVTKYQQNEKELASEIVTQEKLPSYFVLNANCGKSFRLKKKRTLSFNVSVSNMLNNKNIITGGYEQLRWDPQQINRFPNKYSYLPGTTYMIIVNYSF
jgi:hypothetical protein